MRSLLQAHLRLSVAGAKLEDSEVRSVTSNQSEMEFSSLQDMVRLLFYPSVLGEGYFYQSLPVAIDKTKCGSWLMDQHFRRIQDTSLSLSG